MELAFTAGVLTFLARFYPPCEPKNPKSTPKELPAKKKNLPDFPLGGLFLNQAVDLGSLSTLTI